MNLNYYQSYDYPSQSYTPQNYSNVVRVQNENNGSQPLFAGAVGKSQRLSATWCEEFFENFDFMDMEFNESEKTAALGFYENHVFRNNENNEVVEEKQRVDKKEPQIILNKPFQSSKATQPKRKRIQKFKTHFTPGQPCKAQTTNSINLLLRNRSHSRSPTTLTPTRVDSNASSFENAYLNPPQPQYYSSRSPSLSPSLSPSDFSSSASSSYSNQNYCFSFSPENYPPQQNNQLLYPSNQWNYSNFNNN